MFENSLSDWRKILLLRGEPLSEIFVLFLENSEELRGSEELGALFYKKAEKEVVPNERMLEEGGGFSSFLLPRRKARKKRI